MAITSIKTGSSFTNLVKYNDFLGPNPAFNPSSYESIASATGTGSSGTITFSSIPATYASLQIRSNFFRTAYGTPSVLVQLNGDTGTNYAFHWLNGNGTTASALGRSTADSVTSMRLIASTPDIDATYGSAAILDIHDYASTTKNKTIRSFGGFDGNDYFGTGFIGLLSGLWLNTNAVTSITISLSSGNFSTNSTFALYGIKG
jgi:hypothetical protein